MRRYYKYQEAPTQNSTYELKSKQLLNSSALAPTTVIKNPETELLRLPHLNSMRRSASVVSTERNTKFKLSTIEDKAQELGAEVYNLRLDTQQTINHISYLKDGFLGGDLAKISEDLRKQVKGLDRLAKAVQAADDERSRVIKQDCCQLWKQTEALHQGLFELRLRTQQLEESMGFGHTN